MPRAGAEQSVAEYLENNTPPTGYWGHADAYFISLMKAWWGAAATAANDWCFDYLPRLTGDHSTYPTTLAMLEGKVKGFFLLGENPAVGSGNSRLHRLAMAQLDWLVVRDFQEIESASFWHDAPEIETGELQTAQIGTEVFLMPAAAHTEKNGTFTNTQRLLQWHHEAVPPPGDARSELWFMYHLGRRIRERLAGSPRAARPAHPRSHLGLPDARAARRARRRGGAARDQRLRRPTGARFRVTRSCARTARRRAGAGSTAAASRTASTRPRAASPASEQSWVAPEWAWAWPLNRRMLYNRASADPGGRPWSERKRYVWWDGEAGRWTGADVPDFKADMPPDYDAAGRSHGGGRAARRRAVRAAGRRPRVAVRADGGGRRPAAGPLRAPRVAFRQRAVRPAVEPRAHPLRTRAESVQPERGRAGRRRLPLRRHHLPPDGAPHRRRDVAHAPLPGRAAARDVLRGRPRAGRRARPRARRLGHDRDGSHRDRGARARHRPHPARCVSAGAPCIRWASPTTGDSVA